MTTCKDCLHECYTEELAEVEQCCNFFLDKSKYAPVKYVRWILGHVEPEYCTPGGNRPWVCSECGRVVSWGIGEPNENFCPNCGADMRDNPNDS